MLNIIDRQVDAGIFSDKGIDAVKEATIRLRELPKPVREALSAIGIDAEKIRKKIDEEGIGAAIQSVSAKLGDFKDDSPEVGQAIADIFGGAGEDAGVDFIKSLATIEDTTDGLIDKSNEYQTPARENAPGKQRFCRRTKRTRKTTRRSLGLFRRYRDDNKDRIITSPRLCY